MDSDSDEDFLSADEGDDEIVDKIPPEVNEDIQITLKTGAVTLVEENSTTDFEQEQEGGGLNQKKDDQVAILSEPTGYDDLVVDENSKTDIVKMETDDKKSNECRKIKSEKITSNGPVLTEQTEDDVGEEKLSEVDKANDVKMDELLVDSLGVDVAGEHSSPVGDNVKNTTIAEVNTTSDEHFSTKEVPLQESEVTDVPGIVCAPEKNSSSSHSQYEPQEDIAVNEEVKQESNSEPLIDEDKENVEPNDPKDTFQRDNLIDDDITCNEEVDPNDVDQLTLIDDSNKNSDLKNKEVEPVEVNQSLKNNPNEDEMSKSDINYDKAETADACKTKESNEKSDHWSDDDFADDFSSDYVAIKKQDTPPDENLRTVNGGTTDEEWGWDSWADNLISHASTKVTTLMEAVEGQLGIPDPNHLAKNIKAAEIQKEEEKKNIVNNQNNAPDPENQPKESTSSWFSSFVPVSSITNLVQITGQDLVSGGIDALEYLGKSTVTYLSEGDPGLRNKRKALFEKKKGPSLASVLQEAKMKTEEKERCGSIPLGEDPKKLNDMLEKFQAIAHMDAIQMLSADCEAKVKRILNVQSDEARDESLQVLENIKELYELDEDEESNLEDIDFKRDVFALTKRLKIKVTCSKLLNAWSKLNEKSDTMDFDTSDKCFESCIALLAEFISRCIEYYRKVADMMIMTNRQAKELVLERAEVLKSITELFQCEVSGLSNKFANYLANNDEDKKSSDFITDIYMESENCRSLLQDSHELLLPILHSSAIK